MKAFGIDIVTLFRIDSGRQMVLVPNTETERGPSYTPVKQ
jgi:hypothetical protein